MEQSPSGQDYTNHRIEELEQKVKEQDLEILELKRQVSQLQTVTDFGKG